MKMTLFVRKISDHYKKNRRNAALFELDDSNENINQKGDDSSIRNDGF